MATLVRFILFVFVLWIVWRIITRRMRRTVVAMELSTQYIADESHVNNEGIRVITKATLLSVSPMPVTQYDVLCRFAHLLWHNAKARPRMMGKAVLKVLRRPR